MDLSIIAREIGCSESTLNELAQQIIQEALKSLPLVNENIIKRSGALHKMSEDFYRKNPDLLEHKPTVASIIEQVESENPGISFDKLLDKAGARSREFLKLNDNFKRSKPEKSTLHDLDISIGQL